MSYKPEFIHEPLPDGKWIRLFRLENHVPGEVVRCSLKTVLLEDVVGNYDALSYVWGPEDPPVAILIDGKRYGLRQNLNNFLLALSKFEKDSNRYYWVR